MHKKRKEDSHHLVCIEDALKNIPTERLDKDLKVAELKLLGFAAEHNLPFKIFEHLPQFIRSFQDTDVINSLQCSRTKATDLVNEKVGPYAQLKLASILKRSFFSVIIDETTDVSTSKCLVIIVRFYSREESRVKDCFFGLIELTTSSAEDIFKATVGIFHKFDIPLENIIGFASDNASVMMGQFNGVKAKLKGVIPHVFTIGCLSHSIHLCASKACSHLPDSVENMTRNIYNYFSHSAKRQHDFKEFQQFVDAEPHKLLRPCQTRWLSLEAVSEAPKINILLPTIMMFYKMILQFYMKKEIFYKINIKDINPSNPHHFLKEDEIYLGAKVQIILNEARDLIPPQALRQFKTKCLSFYITLCNEIRSRIDFSDTTLSVIADTLDMSKIFSEERLSIRRLVSRFPNIVKDSDTIENLNLEWHLIDECKTDNPPADIESLIILLRKQRNRLGQAAFENLSKFLETIVSLPHSSVAAEMYSKMGEKLSAVEAELYDRQIRLWGIESQEK
ncbi:unnamed protein product [Callosobruchus maculatus]|uniref:Uncharacterized protein n=1 Tax=Callosobruchus maculatus TaxID=64391 RepID=A0A653D012_CALMS|nr:unnamed protein product [Callosobruchus maculatus]